MVNNKEALIKYRIERCKETIEEANLAIENNRSHLAENRIYYSIFYIVSALALKNNFSTSKHSQLKGWFNKNFILTGKIAKELGEIYYNVFENRMEGDYEDLVSFEIEDVKKDYQDMLRFVEEIGKLLETEQL
jgi:uncharacterized protein (UPF0332 family)